MKLEFLTTEFVPGPHLIGVTEKIFATAAGEVGVPLDSLSLVIVADDDHYAEAVERIEPGGGYTNHESGMRGMAKAHTQRLADGTLVSGIVIHLHALDGAMAAIFGAVDHAGRDPAVDELCRYLIYHELGHCKDDRTRPDRENPTIFAPGRGFEIHQIGRYYADILEEEYAASIFSAPWMSIAAHRNCVDALAEPLAHLRTDSEKLKTEYASDPGVLDKLAITVAGWCWFALIQFAKTAASRRANPELASATSLGVWPGTEEAMIPELLLRFEADLTQHWATYPDWAGEPPSFLRETWETLALLNGFRFVEAQRGSAVYW